MNIAKLVWDTKNKITTDPYMTTMMSLFVSIKIETSTSGSTTLTYTAPVQFSGARGSDGDGSRKTIRTMTHGAVEAPHPLERLISITRV